MKRKTIVILSLLVILLFNAIVFAQDKENVYVLPIKGEINQATYNFLNSTLTKITRESPKAIIFEIDTYGGVIDYTEKIKNLIMDLNVPTISFVKNKAESAGVLITISGEKVVMAESSTIGSAETIPNTEKVLSMWRSFLRDAAQQRGRNTHIVEAMADSDIYIDGISEKGKLVNLTSSEALKYGIADFVSDDYAEFLSHFDISYSNIVKIDESLELKFAKMLASPQMNTILLTIAFVGLVIEIFTPGFGIGGAISIISFGLFFAGNIMVGNSQWTSLIIFIVGLILLIIEAIAPGFGLPGISGIILIIVGTILAMGSLQSALMSLSISIIITAIITIILIKQGHRSKILDKVILSTDQKDEDGYLSSSIRTDLLGKEGISVSELRPSGIIKINEDRLDALSNGGFIPKNTKIKVVKVEGSKIIVRRL